MNTSEQYLAPSPNLKIVDDAMRSLCDQYQYILGSLKI